MILFKGISKRRPILKLAERAILGMNINAFYMSGSKKDLDQELLDLANNINPNNINEDYSEIANNYIQLEESSFA